MSRSTFIGLILGGLVFASALLLGHVPLRTMINPEALVIVLGGTITATTLAFPFPTILAAFNGLRKSSPESQISIEDTTHYVMDIVRFVRDEGILALQPLLAQIELPFLRKGLGLLMDNRSESFVRDNLTTELEVIYRQNLDYAKVFETAGGFSPTMGIIGAIIGLIHVMESAHDPGKLGQGVANAFSATLYGVAVSNLFFLPVAAMLRHRARTDWFIKTLILESIMRLRAGEHPMMIEERLMAFSARPDQDSLTAEAAASYMTPPPRRPQQVLPVQPQGPQLEEALFE